MNKGEKKQNVKAKAIKQNYHNQFLKKKIIYKLRADTI